MYSCHVIEYNKQNFSSLIWKLQNFVLANHLSTSSWHGDANESSDQDQPIAYIVEYLAIFTGTICSPPTISIFSAVLFNI